MKVGINLLRMLTRILIASVCVFFILSCGSKQESAANSLIGQENSAEPTLQISLAQWSLHRSFLGPMGDDYWSWFGKTLSESPQKILRGTLDPINFPAVAAEYGFKSIELVNVFYFSKVDDESYWKTFKQKCEEAGVQVGLIMCDHLGQLADSDSLAREVAVKKHYQWVNIAKNLGAHSIRVNAAGEGTPEEVASQAVDGLTKLGKYGKSKGINIIVENHGGLSSNGKWLSGVLNRVGMENVGTLPDFGNFCIEWNENGCSNEYDRYQGMEELMPFAKGVSAKSFEFDDNGNEENTDFYRMMKIVKNSGYKGFVGIEYEGALLSEEEGIKATKTLLEKAINEL